MQAVTKYISSLFFFTVSFLLCACATTGRPPLHYRPPGFRDTEKATVQILHDMKMVPIDKDIKMEPQEGEGLATGFVVNVNGWVLTNYHVVSHEEANLRNKLPPGFEYVPDSDKYEVCDIVKGKRKCAQAKLVASDKGYDFALLKVNIIFKEAITFTDDHNLQVGDQVYLRGSIFDWAPPSPLFGRIINRMESPYVPQKDWPGDLLPFLLTDVTFVQGSSGGPMFDWWSRCVGQGKLYSNSEHMGGGRPLAMLTPSTQIMEFLKENNIPYKFEK